MKRLKTLSIIVLLLSLHGSVNLLTAQNASLERVLRTHISILAADTLEGRGLGTEGKIKAEKYIEEQFAAAGILPWKGQFRHPFSFLSGIIWVQATNFIGYIPGTDPVLRDEFIVIGAHYDHVGYRLEDGKQVIYPGADDNASGVASIIELGRYFASPGNQTRRSIIIVAFDAEEVGLHGAKSFVNDSIVPLEKIKLMYSLDMVGMLMANSGLELKGMETIKSGGEAANQAAAKFGINIKKMGTDIETRTDTEPFGMRGIPAVHVFTGLKSPYHKPGDKYDLLDYEGMARINLFLRELNTSLGNRDVLAPIDRFEKIAETGTFRSRRAEFGVLIMNGGGHHRFPDEFFRAKSIYNFNGGFYGTYHFNNFIALQPEVLFDMNGSRRADGKVRFYSITTPISLQIGTPTRNQGFRLYLIAGAYYRYHFNGNDPNGSLNFFTRYNQNDWGINTGLGLNISKFTVGWTYRRGLTNLSQIAGTNLRDANSLFVVGLRF